MSKVDWKKEYLAIMHIGDSPNNPSQIVEEPNAMILQYIK